MISITWNVDFADILHPKGGVMQNDLKIICTKQIIILFLISRFKNKLSQPVLKKYIRAICVFKVILRYKILLDERIS